MAKMNPFRRLRAMLACLQFLFPLTLIVCVGLTMAALLLAAR